MTDAKRKPDNIVKIDTNADGNKYIGEAPAGSATSDEVWHVTRDDKSNPQTLDNAAGIAWDDRTTASYI